MTYCYDIAKLLRHAILGAIVSLLPVYVFADTLSVALIQDKSGLPSQLEIAQSYRIVALELERTLLLQNIITTKVDADKPVFGTSFLDDQFANQDYVIVYSIFPEISQNRVARTLSMSASGQIIDQRSRLLVTSFQVKSLQTVTLPQNEVACNTTCVKNEITKISNDLARELSFVLTQKLHFLREDQVHIDTTYTAAIITRLIGSTEQVNRIEAIRTDAGRYQIDKDRRLDVEIYFDIGSAELSDQSKSQLMSLGKALATVELSNSRYLVVGHTDAKGSAEYNRMLSNQRAQAVREYLIQSFAILPDRLTAVGLGEERLRTPEEPHAAVNRRVEFAALVSGPKPNDASMEYYTLTFSLIPRDVIIHLVRQLEASSVDEVELLKSSNTQRQYSVRTDLTLMNLKELLLMALLSQGFEPIQLRISIEDTTITVENLY